MIRMCDQVKIYKYKALNAYEDAYFSRLGDVVFCPTEDERMVCYYAICVEYGRGCTSKIVCRLTDVVDGSPVVSSIHKDVLANILRVNNRNRTIPKWQNAKITALINAFENLDPT